MPHFPDERAEGRWPQEFLAQRLYLEYWQPWVASGDRSTNDKDAIWWRWPEIRNFSLIKFFFASNDLNIETEWTKTVIAADHGTHRVFHPSIIKIAFSFSQRLYELPHRRPCRRTHPIGTFSINGNPLLAHFYIAGMFDGILVLGHQVRVNRLSDSCNPYLIHTNWHILV